MVIPTYGTPLRGLVTEGHLGSVLFVPCQMNTSQESSVHRHGSAFLFLSGWDVICYLFLQYQSLSIYKCCG